MAFGGTSLYGEYRPSKPPVGPPAKVLYTPLIKSPVAVIGHIGRGVVVVWVVVDTADFDEFTAKIIAVIIAARRRLLITQQNRQSEEHGQQ